MPFAHLRFSRHWELSADTIYRLGRCQALLDNIAGVPLRPEVQRELKRVSLVKGAQATTAIEGNTLAEADIEKIVDKAVDEVIDEIKLGESKAYQAQEVKNIIEAMNHILNQSQPRPITPQLLLEYHRFVGNELPPPFSATPGQFAQSQRVVGGYRCPPPGRGKQQVEGLVTRFCEWLAKEFGSVEGEQSFTNGIIRAIVAHVYIEWLHPFDDGNGRTGRLVEFYLLLCAGVPDICAHILSNHYNTTRPQYYDQIRRCQIDGDLTSFIDYAVTGFLDGLNEVWGAIAGELIGRAWRGHVYDRFADIKWSRPTFIRRRKLLLDMQIGERYTVESIQLASAEIIKEYSKVSVSTVKRDIAALVEAELLVEDPESGEIWANSEILKAQYPAMLRK